MSVADILPHVSELTDAQAERWVEAAITEAHALFAHERERVPSTSDPAEVAQAEAIHAALGRWASSAQVLYDHLRSTGMGVQLYRVSELDRVIGHALARLSIEPTPPEDGPWISMEEVKRELRGRRAAQRVG